MGGGTGSDKNLETHKAFPRDRPFSSKAPPPKSSTTSPTQRHQLATKYSNTTTYRGDSHSNHHTIEPFTRAPINMGKREKAPHLSCVECWCGTEMCTGVRRGAEGSDLVVSVLKGAALGSTGLKLHCWPTQATDHQRPEQAE